MTGAARRRRWSLDERARILAAVAEPGAVVAEAARAADVCTGLVYKWRREAERSSTSHGLSGFVPVTVETPAVPSSAACEPCVIVVEVGGARVRIGVDAPAASIAVTLKALRP